MSEEGSGMVDQELFSRERLAGYNPRHIGRSTVLVVGAGALGQNAIQNLALAGIGTIVVVDNDRFESHNRTRSPAYPLLEEQQQLGLGKARAVAFKLRRLMTAPQPVMRYADALIQEIGDGAFMGVSVILSCVDNPRARAYLADKARLHSIPLVEGGFDGPDLSISCYPAARGETARHAPCWRCAHQELDGAFSCRFYAEQAEERGIIPAVQNAAAVLAGLQSEAAIMAIHGHMPLADMALDLNVRTGATRTVHLSSDPCCPGLHRSLGSEPTMLTTSATDSVMHLLHELTEYMGTDIMVQLPQPLVWSAPCTQCGQPTDAHAPDWRWMSAPRCCTCGGPFPLLNDDSNAGSPIVYPVLSRTARPDVLAASCRQVGLPPLSLMEVYTDNDPPRFFRLAGTLDDLFETIPAVVNS